MIDKNQSSMIKEFREKDVTRMRNLLTGKSGEKTQVLSGYEKSEEDYAEGDVWEDIWGKTWTIQNGIKRTVTKNSRLKELALLPMSCPSCGNLMKVNDLNKKMWAIHKECFDCTITRETRLKSEGKWEEYERSQMNKNVKTSLEEFESAIDSWYNEKDTYITEAGDIEAWSGGDKFKIYQEIKDNLQKIKSEDIYK
jgi:hypothetical protein